MDTTSVPQGTPVGNAVEALVAELEREHAWLADLKADLARVEQRCGHLLNAADSALLALAPAARREFVLRIRRLQIDHTRIGRPPADGRRVAVLSRLAEKGHGRITNAEVRGHLTRLGHKGTSAYVGNLLYKLTQEGLLLKSGYGEYTIAHDNPRLRALRFREHREELIAEMRAEREGKGGRQPPPETEVMRAEPGSSAALFTPANPRIVQRM